MNDTQRPLRQDRLTELVAHLTGAPLDHARTAVSAAADRNGVWGDSLRNVADALVTIQTAA